MKGHSEKHKHPKAARIIAWILSVIVFELIFFGFAWVLATFYPAPQFSWEFKFIGGAQKLSGY